MSISPKQIVFPMSVDLSKLLEKGRYLPVKFDLKTICNEKDLLKRLSVNAPPEYDFVVNGQIVSFERLIELKKNDKGESRFGLVDTQIYKTKEELGVDFIKIGKCLFIFEDSKTIFDYLQFYKFKGCKPVKKTKEITQRIVKESRLFMSYKLFTYQDIEDNMDLEVKKIQEMREELETLSTANAKLRRRVKTLEKRIEKIEYTHKNPSINPVFAGQKKRRIPYYSNIKFPEMEFFCHNKKLRKPIAILNGDEKFSNFFINALKKSGALICGGYALLNFFNERDMKCYGNYREDDIEWIFDYTLDIDIFSFNLNFLREMIEYLFQRQIGFEVACFKFYRLDSYKISDIRDMIPINIVHLGDNVVPKDLIDLSPEQNREKIMKFMCERFDISACITCYDGEEYHYNDSIEKRLIECRYSTKTRVEKYQERGFTVSKKFESDKDIEQVMYSHNLEDV